MELSDIVKERIKHLSPLMQSAVRMLVDCIDRILGGDCDEGAVANTVAAINANSRGKYSSEDLVTYDKAMSILGITDRRKLKKTLDENGISQVTIHNQKVGFPRGQVLALKQKLKK